MTTTDHTGRLLAGRYRLEAELGSGSSAEVWRAVDLRLNRLVAVKLLHPGLVTDESFLRRFRAEAQIVAQLNHRHVLRVFDWGEGPEGAYLVSEYLAGGSLRDLYDRGEHLSLSQVCSIGIACAHGLAYAHRRGLVHRDIKPANLLFDEEGEVRIADFGLARALAEAAWTEPSGTVLGTARYASPEQAEGRPLDGRSDVYSLTLVLYEAVTGQVPFTLDTTLATLQARIGRSLPPSRALGALYPILAEASIADPLARLEAAELAVELELLKSTLPKPEPLPVARVARPVPPPEPTAPTTDAPSPAKAGAEDLFAAFGPLVAPPGASAPGMKQGAGAYEDDTLLVAAPTRTVGAEEELTLQGVPEGAPTMGWEQDEEGGDEGPRPRRRWGRRILAVLCLLALAGGAAAYADLRLVKQHVPSLRGDNAAAARSSIIGAGLVVGHTSRAYSLTVPAGEVISQSPGAGTARSKGAKVSFVLSEGPHPVQLPRLAGTSLTAAIATLEQLHLNRTVHRSYEEQVARGVIVSSDPGPGSVPYGSTVTLVVSLGPAPRTIPANLVGASWSNVQSALNNLRLVPSEHLAYSNTVPSGTVMAVSPSSGTSGVAVGSTVTVTVSEGPQYVTVPTVAGESITNAVADLQSAGLQVTEVIGPPFATTAVTTNPVAGTSVVTGSQVTLYAS